MFAFLILAKVMEYILAPLVEGGGDAYIRQGLGQKASSSPFPKVPLEAICFETKVFAFTVMKDCSLPHHALDCFKVGLQMYSEV